MMSDKQIEIIEERDPYSRIPHDLIRDDRLRLQTRMVLIMMLSCHPDWDFSIRGMAKIAHVTKDTMSKMMGELETAGYVRRKTQARKAAGQFAKAGYLVSSRPIFAEKNEEAPCHKKCDAEGEDSEPCPDLSYTEEPYTINSPQINNKQIINKQINTPLTPSGQGGGGAEKSKPKYQAEWFETFWKKYPLKKARKPATKAWDKLKPSQELCRIMYGALRRDICSEQWKRGVIPLFGTWLNDRRWEDEHSEPDFTSGGWAPDPEVIT